MNSNKNHPLPLSVNVLKHPTINIILELLDIVVEVLVTPTVDSLVTLNINLALSHAQILALNILINSIPIIILRTMIVIALAMTKTIKNLLRNMISFSPILQVYTLS